ncbi:MAG: hypothetical protein ACOYMN_09975 [Roseimicrobium sp.]
MMATDARVLSVEELEHFRSALWVFMERSRGCVDQISDELRRTGQWLANDQRLHWAEQCRKCARLLDQVKSELLTAKRSNLLENCAAYELAVKRARLALATAEEKLENVKRWSRDFDRAAGPLERRLESLQHFLHQTLPRGAAHLGQLIGLLESYAMSAVPAQAGALPTASAVPEEPSVPS